MKDLISKLEHESLCEIRFMTFLVKHIRLYPRKCIKFYRDSVFRTYPMAYHWLKENAPRAINDAFQTVQ